MSVDHCLASRGREQGYITPRELKQATQAKGKTPTIEETLFPALKTWLSCTGGGGMEGSRERESSSQHAGWSATKLHLLLLHHVHRREAGVAAGKGGVGRSERGKVIGLSEHTHKRRRHFK